MKKTLNRNRVAFYILVGLGYASLWMLGDAHKYSVSFGTLLSNNIWRVIYIIVINFIFFEYTMPFVFRKRSYIIFNIVLGIVLLWVHCIGWSYGLYAWRLLCIELHLYTVLQTFANSGQAYAAQMGYSVGSLFFFAVARHIYNYVKLQQATQQLRIEKQAAELNYLRSQTNPHFLFNTLNNIYSLSRDKSELAPESILRLSKILRFMLYETGGDYIAIEDEIKIITDYIALEKLRYDESLHVNFNYSVENMKQALPPLLLIPLVENAFKHGASETRNNPFIDIHLSVSKRQLTFVVKNSSEPAPEDQRVKENIGLSNLRRQLELLYKDYDLSAHQNQSVFTAQLTINLASHV
jgi:sensor histidine kinase YesM